MSCSPAWLLGNFLGLEGKERQGADATDGLESLMLSYIFNTSCRYHLTTLSLQAQGGRDRSHNAAKPGWSLHLQIEGRVCLSHMTFVASQ